MFKLGDLVKYPYDSINIYSIGIIAKVDEVDWHKYYYVEWIKNTCHIKTHWFGILDAYKLGKLNG